MYNEHRHVITKMIAHDLPSLIARRPILLRLPCGYEAGPGLGNVSSGWVV